MTKPAYRRVLASIDLGLGAERVLNTAADLARSTGARLTILHVVEPTTATDVEGSFTTPQAQQRALVSAARERLQTLALRAACSDAELRIVIGHPYGELQRVASEVRADVVATHNWWLRWTALWQQATRWLFGQRTSYRLMWV
jgi:universal stress protein A